MPVVRSYMKMLRRNLLYTGITRAKNFLILCGDADVFKFGIERTDDLARLTSLKERLTDETMQESETFTKVVDEELIPEGTEEVVLTASNYLTIHPLIGMKGTSPYDFLEDVN